jgi:dTDP-glucose pyrophosphorylase
MISLNSSIGEAVINLDKTGIKIVMVLNDAAQLEGTISDGDIRRGLLRGLGLDSPIKEITHRNALVVPPGLSGASVRQLMVANKILQIPIVDEKHRIVGLHLWDEFTAPHERENIMVIMAGGMGLRMRPQTEKCPKPLLKVAGKPILEHIIERAKSEGFNKFIIAVHYLGEMIEDYLGCGENLGVQIGYLREQSPLGTAGALSLLDLEEGSPIVVTNGDLISDIRYGELVDFHCQHNVSATMAVRLHEWQHPFGVVLTEGLNIVGFEEKPISRNYVNAGIYVLNRSALSFLEKNQFCDMPALFGRIQENDSRTIAYPMHEPWLDVGRPDDLMKANDV